MVTKKSKIWLPGIVALVVMLTTTMVLAGCQNTATTRETTKEDKPTEESTAGSLKFDGYILIISGSTTLLEVSTAWAEAFMSQFGGEVTINGGGSGVGIADLLNGSNDLANASRSMKDQEWEAAEESGIEVKEYVVLFDGIAVITSKNIEVPELTIKQLADIFMGNITNWSEVGGPDAEIIAAARDSSSGTGEYFLERVVQLDKTEEDNDYGDIVLRLQSNADVVNQVIDNDNTIGYIGLGYLGDAANSNLVKISDDGEAIEPSIETVKDKSYPIARDLYVYANGNNMSDIAVAFIDFMLSPEGQEIGEDVGFVAVK